MKTICFHILTKLFSLSSTQLKFPLGTWIKYFPFDKHKIYWFIGCSDKESACQCRRHKRCGFYLWVRKIPWRRKSQPAPVFLPGKFHGQRWSLVGHSPWGHKVSDMSERLGIPHHLHDYLSTSFVRSVVALDSPRSSDPTEDYMWGIQVSCSLWESSAWWSQVELTWWCWGAAAKANYH